MCQPAVAKAIAAAVAAAIEAKASFTARNIQHNLEKHCPMFEVSNEVGSLFNAGAFGRGWIAAPVFRHSGTKQFTLYTFSQEIADTNDYHFTKYNKGARKHAEAFGNELEEYQFDAEEDECWNNGEEIPAVANPDAADAAEYQMSDR